MKQAAGFALSTLLLAAGALAHGKPESQEVRMARRALIENNKRAFDGCAATLARRDDAIKRRSEWAQKLSKRTYGYEIDHHSNLTGLTTENAESIVFSGEHTCVLAEDVTEGPYFVDGEYIRTDIREDEPGVDLYLDIQVIDVNTCDTVSGVYIDLWHANSTGVYSGVVATGNGDGSESNLNNTALRGVYPTDDNGVVQFITKFPGWYTGRATHIHVVANNNGTVETNGTYQMGTVSHVGQLAFDQDLLTEIRSIDPYTTNTAEVTENTDDSILIQEYAEIDPTVEYVLLGDSLEDGILGWITFVINSTESTTISAAAFYGEDGGYSENSGMGGGGGAPGGDMPGNMAGAPGSGSPPDATGSVAGSMASEVIGSASASSIETSSASASDAAVSASSVVEDSVAIASGAVEGSVSASVETSPVQGACGAPPAPQTQQTQQNQVKFPSGPQGQGKP